MIHYTGIFSFCLLTVVNSVCYYPNGQSEQSLVYQPCPGRNGQTAMCCATNRTNPSGGSLSDGLTADMCLENGLCMNTHTLADGRVISDYWRDQCTVSDWSSGGCLDVCSNGTDGTSNGTAQITPCDGTETSDYWCCGLNNVTCCNTSAAISIAANLHKSTSTLTSSSSTFTSSISTPTTITSSLTTQISTDSGDFSSGLSSGAKIGIGIGCGVGAALGAILLLLSIQKQRKNRSKIMETSATRPPRYVNQHPRELGAEVHQPPGELDSEALVGKFTRDLVSTPSIRHELHAELPSDT